MYVNLDVFTKIKKPHKDTCKNKCIDTYTYVQINGYICKFV